MGAISQTVYTASYVHSLKKIVQPVEQFIVWSSGQTAKQSNVIIRAITWIVYIYIVYLLLCVQSVKQIIWYPSIQTNNCYHAYNQLNSLCYHAYNQFMCYHAYKSTEQFICYHASHQLNSLYVVMRSWIVHILYCVQSFEHFICYAYNQLNILYVIMRAISWTDACNSLCSSYVSSIQ